MPIVATPGQLKLTQTLGFRLDHRNNLGKGLHQFGLGQYTPAARKVLKVHANQHQVVVGGGTAPSPADVATLTASDDVSLSATMHMALRAHTWLRVVLVTLFRPDHPTTLARKELNTEIIEREIELEEYNPRDRGLNCTSRRPSHAGF